MVQAVGEVMVRMMMMVMATMVVVQDIIIS